MPTADQHKPRQMKVARARIIKHEAVAGSGSFEVRFADGRASIYFYWEDHPSSRLSPVASDRETALKEAKAAARAVRASLD